MAHFREMVCLVPISKQGLIIIVGLLLLPGLSCSDKSTSSAIPRPPSNLTGQSLSSSVLEIRWNDNSDNETAFLVFRGYGDDWTPAATTPADRISYRDSLLQDSTRYRYYVVARNDAGQSPPSDTLALSTLSIGAAPSPPANPLPVDESDNVSHDITLEWTCADTDGDSLTYDLYFGQGAYLSRLDSNLAVARYTPGPLLYDTRYNWRIEAKDDHHHAALGPVWHFTTAPNTPPDQPTQPNPPHNSLGAPLHLVLSWECGDSDGDSLTYDAYFGPGTNRQIVASNLAIRSFDPEGLMYNTQYTWRIAASDTFSNETMGPIWSFTTRDSNYTLQTLLQGRGSILRSPDDISFEYGDTVVLTAVPDQGWHFSGWSQDTTGRANPLTVVIQRNMIIVGNFSEGIPPARISGTVSWPGYVLSNHTYAFADSFDGTRLYLVGNNTVDSATGAFTITLNGLPHAVSLRFEAQDDVNNSGPWNPIDAGDGWGFYDLNGDSLWNDVILVSPGDNLTGIDITLQLRTLTSLRPERSIIRGPNSP